ncbi:NAD(P)H-quinone oxidoreductase subunit J, chloroplastic [Oligella urethralis]|uniref:NADH-quinone oxidoreductase subunit C n=1 Tax=Oligella TaxID=90243 RepID=UPI0008A156E2|nr:MULTISPECIES: NADH-quinone oxidoreductase subunit C [Oligella]OFS88822.1 NADH-quinone oxidoreductase subunit C [Oligella sp. HMSC05A10]WOS38155.1 NAD(P)H-quinone oxidoreductase subunit J, chloroplastic [Oligella urethralis]
MTRLEKLHHTLVKLLGEQAQIVAYAGELTLTVAPEHWVQTCSMLHEHEELAFQQAIDLCGVDYLTYGGVSVAPEDNQPLLPTEATADLDAALEPVDAMPSEQPSQFPGRFAVVLHLLSVKHNWRLRVRTFPQDNDFPSVPSLVNIWNSLNWFEREAFDLFGIVFEGHPDLRRILTDYGFIGHPFRKDFPVIGHVEMIYDPEQKRVVYQPVSIENREITPRVIREEGYGAGRE